MKLSVSAYRAHTAAHKKILDTAYQLNYGATAASHHVAATPSTAGIRPFQIDDPASDVRNDRNEGTSSDEANTPLQSPRSQHTSHEEDEEEVEEVATAAKRSPTQRGVESRRSADDGDDGHPQGRRSWRHLRAVLAYYHALRTIQRAKSNQRWMKLRTTVQISSAIQKKPTLKREDSFLQRFASRPPFAETQETLEDTGSECGGGGSSAPGGRGGGGGPGGGGRAPGAGGPAGDDVHGGAQAAAARRRRRARRRRQPLTVVNPDESFYFHWLLVQTVSVLYNLWTLIVRQSFPECQTLLADAWLACDCVSDACFVLDVAVQLRTGYLEQGLMVYDARKLAAHYVRSRAFLLDVVAVCPLDLLQLRLGAQPMLRFPRFLKVYRAVDYYYMVESRTVYPNLWRVLNLIHILLILAHWFGCFYFLLSEAEGFQGDWVYPHRPGDYATLTRKYLGSLYWSTLTLTTIGDLPTPETNAERTHSVDGPRSLPRRGIKSRLLQFSSNEGYVFTIVSYLIGVFIFATIVGQVGNVITNRNANRLEFERLLDGAKTYMRHHKVPGGMKRRVLRWYDYSWSRGRIQGGGDINTALGLLPDKLKTELALHVNLSVLKKVTIFQECQPEFLRDLVLKMKAYIFTPGDAICRKGEVAREMFIIADGILEVCGEAGRVLTTMKAGDFFGEIGILNLDGLNKRTADVRSVGYSELFSLSREDVLAAMTDYPEAQDILQALGRKRLMEVRASARQHRKEKEALAAADGKRLVDKIRSEAKGLRNVLRKSRTQRRASQDSIELRPLPTPPKAVLKRMSHVRSDELPQEAEAPPETTSPLGAGLPLLARLRLLKEKQADEERPPVASPPPPPPPPAPGVDARAVQDEKEEEEEVTVKSSDLGERSRSADGGDAVHQVQHQVRLTRSWSEGSSTMRRRRSSGESDETLERRHLKSILKTLSEARGRRLQVQQPQAQLLRAHTAEGYAARHAKLAKSVTFQRHTLPSPPGAAPEHQVPPQTATDGDQQQQPQPAYLADILVAIKQMMGAQLCALQERYEERVRRLEAAVRARDATIARLQAHIADLEHSAADNSETETTATTVVASGGPCHPQDHVVLDMDSNTDTEEATEEDGDGMDSGDASDDVSTAAPGAGGNDWEVEMLAAQMVRQQRRSASLDYAVTRRRVAMRDGGASCSCDAAH